MNAMLLLAGHQGPVTAVAYSPDGMTLASASYDATVKLWNMATGRERLSLHGHTGRVWSIAFSPEGSRLFSTSGDRNQPGQVCQWDAATGRLRAVLAEGHPAALAVAFSADGRRLAAARCDGTVQLWERGQSKAIILTRRNSTGWEHGRWRWYRTARTQPHNCSLAFSPDGATLACAGGSLQTTFWDLSTHANHSLPCLLGPAFTLTYSPDGRTLALGRHTGVVQFRDAVTGRKQAAFKKHRGRVQSLVYCPDGDCILSGGEDGCVRWWDVQTGRDRAAFAWQIGRINGVAVAPDGMTAAASGQAGQTVVWDLDAQTAS
jgi:WD40 repeat protein